MSNCGLIEKTMNMLHFAHGVEFLINFGSWKKEIELMDSTSLLTSLRSSLKAININELLAAQMSIHTFGVLVDLQTILVTFFYFSIMKIILNFLRINQNIRLILSRISHFWGASKPNGFNKVCIVKVDKVFQDSFAFYL